MSQSTGLGSEALWDTPRIQTRTEWDQAWDDFVRLGSLEPASEPVKQPLHDQPRQSDLDVGAYSAPAGDVLSDPFSFDSWNGQGAETRNGRNVEEAINPSVRRQSEHEMQIQINHLRQVVSNLVDNQRSTNHFQAPGRPGNCGAFPSKSFNLQQNDRGNVASGSATPLDAPDGISTPFDFSDDSPIYSRRGSAASIGSLPAKRGARIPGGYPCVKCNARFDVPGELRHHERKHMSKKERPHACSLCAQRFHYPKDVIRHERQKHNIQRPEQLDTSTPGLQTPEKRVVGQRQQRKRPWEHDSESLSSHEQSFQSSRQPRASLKPTSQPASRKGSPQRRRDSAAPDAISWAAHEVRPNLLLPDPDADLSQSLQDLQIQVNEQQQTIDQLREALLESAKDSLTSLRERDILASLLQGALWSSRGFSTDNPEQDPIPPASDALRERANDWLSAMLTMIASSDELGESNSFDVKQLLHTVAFLARSNRGASKEGQKA